MQYMFWVKAMNSKLFEIEFNIKIFKIFAFKLIFDINKVNYVKNT